MDDKLSDDNTHNWEVMFETVVLFLMKKEVAEMGKGKRTSICGMGRWLHCVKGLADAIKTK